MALSSTMSSLSTLLSPVDGSCQDDIYVDRINSKWPGPYYIKLSGADPGLSFRGGAKDYVPSRTLRARNRTHFRQGSRARFNKGTGSSRVVLMLSRAIWQSLLFKHSDKRIELKNIVDPILGGACCPPPPLGRLTGVFFCCTVSK